MHLKSAKLWYLLSISRSNLVCCYQAIVLQLLFVCVYCFALAIAVQQMQYRMGVSVYMRLCMVWLEANEPHGPPWHVVYNQ